MNRINKMKENLEKPSSLLACTGKKTGKNTKSQPTEK